MTKIAHRCPVSTSVLRSLATDPIFKEPPLWGSVIWALIGILAVTLAPYAHGLNLIGHKDTVLMLGLGSCMIIGSFLILLHFHYKKNPVPSYDRRSSIV